MNGLNTGPPEYGWGRRLSTRRVLRHNICIMGGGIRVLHKNNTRCKIVADKYSVAVAAGRSLTVWEMKNVRKFIELITVRGAQQSIGMCCLYGVLRLHMCLSYYFAMSNHLSSTGCRYEWTTEAIMSDRETYEQCQVVSRDRHLSEECLMNIISQIFRGCPQAKQKLVGSLSVFA